MSSLDRMDPIDRALLEEAEMVVTAHLICNPVNPVYALTDPEIRHHVQTILDLTPTKRR